MQSNLLKPTKSNAYNVDRYATYAPGLISIIVRNKLDNNLKILLFAAYYESFFVM